MKIADIPELPGWVALTDLARDMGVSRQGAHKMIARGRIKTCHRVGPVPVYVVKKAEAVKLIADAQESKAAALAEGRELAAEELISDPTEDTAQLASTG